MPKNKAKQAKQAKQAVRRLATEGEFKELYLAMGGEALPAGLSGELDADEKEVVAASEAAARASMKSDLAQPQAKSPSKARAVDAPASPPKQAQSSPEDLQKIADAIRILSEKPASEVKSSKPSKAQQKALEDKMFADAASIDSLHQPDAPADGGGLPM